jgi:signal transduction histidine kinase/DNA-binding response OmpR family regulator
MHVSITAKTALVASVLVLTMAGVTGLAFYHKADKIRTTDGLESLRNYTRLLGYELAFDTRQQRIDAWQLSQPDSKTKRCYAKELLQALRDGAEVETAFKPLAEKLQDLLKEHPHYVRASFFLRHENEEREVLRLDRQPDDAIRLQSWKDSPVIPHASKDRDHLGLPSHPQRTVVLTGLGSMEKWAGGPQVPVLHAASLVYLVENQMPCGLVVLSFDLSASLNRSANYLCFLTDKDGKLWDGPKGFGLACPAEPRNWRDVFEVSGSGLPEAELPLERWPEKTSAGTTKSNSEEIVCKPREDLARWAKGQLYPSAQMKLEPSSFWLLVSKGYERLSAEERDRVRGKLDALVKENPNLRADLDVLHGAQVRLSSADRGQIQKAATLLQAEFPSLGWRTPLECKNFAMHFVKVQIDPFNDEDFLGVAQLVSRDELNASLAGERDSILTQVVALSAGAAVLAGLCSLLVTRPLKRIIKATEGFARGEFDVPLPTRNRSEIGVLARAFQNMVEQVRRRSRELEESEAHVRQLNEDLERRVAERTAELSRANEELAVARDVADASNRAKSQFLANMSHELRTPLNAVIGYTELMQEQAEDEGHVDYLPDLAKIHAAGKHLLTLINDVLDLSRIEAGKVVLSPETLDVNALVGDVVTTIRPLVEKKGNAFVVQCPDDVGSLYADVTRVRQCLFNLLSNAGKFTEKGEIRLEVERRSVEGRERLYFRVRDTGIGMTPEQLQRIFQPFVQADESTTRKYGGTGLGLTITRKLAQMMGGEISVTSEAGKGTQFTLELPAEPAPVAPTVPAPVAPAFPSAPGGPTVVAVDDDPIVLDILTRYLTGEGFRVVPVSHGAEVIRVCREVKPAAITLDVMMPDVDGWSVLAALKREPDLAHVPVIMLTLVEDKNLGHALGAADYLVKPLEPQRLIDTLRRNTRSAPGLALVVEDDPPTREMFRRMLESDGWSVTEAANGREALARVDQSPPGLIVLDLMMPEMDGFEFLTELQQHETWRTIPVVVVTARDLSVEDRQFLNGSMMLSGRAKRVLQKGGFCREDLLREVRGLLAACT